MNKSPMKKAKGKVGRPKKIKEFQDSFKTSRALQDLIPYLQEFTSDFFLCCFDQEGQLQLYPNFSDAKSTLAFAKVLTDFSNALNQSIDNGGMDEGEGEPPENWLMEE